MSAFYIVVTIVIFILIVLYVLKYRYTSKIRKIRDNTDFITKQGKERIKELNKKLDRVNGYRLYNRD